MGPCFFAPDADPTIPAALAGRILAVGGLDSLPGAKSHLKVYKTASPETATAGPPPGYATPDILKTAYNLTSIPADGSGQSIALVEFQGYLASDMEAYESALSLPNVPLQTTVLDGSGGQPAGVEAAADIEVAIAFAPGSSNILIYEAPDSYIGWTDEWTKIAEDNKAKVVSCSYDDSETNSLYTSFDAQNLRQMAAQGQAVFVASGDSGAFGAGGNTLGVDEPASQPYVTGVGGTNLSVTADWAYYFEEAGYSGGGVSGVFQIPSYQAIMASQAAKAALVSTTMRNVPDVVVDGAEAIYYNGSWILGGGTSLSAPVWASFVSLVNQGLGQYSPIGFVNPALYEIAHSGSYAYDFHDITVGNNGYYPAEPGFDDATGLGSPEGLNLYNDLVGVSLALTQGTSVRTLPTFGAAGTSVQILGKELTGATSVTFNGQAATFTVDSPTTIINLGTSRSHARLCHSNIPPRKAPQRCSFRGAGGGVIHGRAGRAVRRGVHRIVVRLESRYRHGHRVGPPAADTDRRDNGDGVRLGGDGARGAAILCLAIADQFRDSRGHGLGAGDSERGRAGRGAERADSDRKRFARAICIECHGVGGCMGAAGGFGSAAGATAGLPDCIRQRGSTADQSRSVHGTDLFGDVRHRYPQREQRDGIGGWRECAGAVRRAGAGLCRAGSGEHRAAAAVFGGRGECWDRGCGGWAGGKHGQCHDRMMPAAAHLSWVVALTIDESTLQRIGKRWPSRSLRITCFSLAEEADEGVGPRSGGTAPQSLSLSHNQ